MLINSNKFPEVRKLVEHRTTFYGKFSEFSTYKTVRPIQAQLKFGNPIVCRMATGKKLMALSDGSTFPFLPGESIVVPSGMLMTIEYPEAQISTPTESICIEIENDRIKRIIAELNEHRANSHTFGEWKFNPHGLSRFKNDPRIDSQIDKLKHIFLHEHAPYKDTLIDLCISELIVRVLQSNSRELLIEETGEYKTHSGLAGAVQFIIEHPGEKFSLDRLSSIACMSQASLYRHFKLEFGESPTQFVTRVKIKKACELLKESDQSVTSICFELGFSNVGHFIERFRRQIGETPKKYRQNVILSTRNL